MIAFTKKNPIKYCNHLLTTTIIYLTIIDPIQEFANNLDKHISSLQPNTIDHKIDTTTTTRRTRLSSLVSATSNNDNNQQDYYEILGVKKDATKHEIHKAFRQLAKKYHPDKNKEKNAQDEFIKIFKAYETLSDEKKRKEYDDMKSNKNQFNNHWQQSNGMHDFDVNEFFKQYEDQFLKHAQFFQQQHFNTHYQQHHNSHDQHDHHHHHHNNNHKNNAHNHEQFTFHGVNLDDLFHDIDENEYQSYGNMFNFGGHNMNNHINTNGGFDLDDGTFGDGASFFGSHISNQIHDTIHQYQNEHMHTNNDYHKKASSNGYSCQTITKQVNGMVMTQTSCM